MKKRKIAILGSTSHIAKGLIYNFLKNDEFDLYLYVRSANKASNFLTSIGKFPDKDCLVSEGFTDFLKYNYDVIINCVGIGTLNKHKGNYSAYFTVTEEYDNLVIAYLRDKCSDALYISFSSGAVYGRGFFEPAGENTANCFSVNHISKEDYYAIARLNAEAKHRAFDDLNIVDLRLFSYFSRFIDLADGYFITEALNCILNKNIFITDDVNFVRDYVGPEDLFLMIEKCLGAGKINAAFDVMSVKPVEKKEILDYFSSEYGLKYKTGSVLNYVSPTGFKNVYYSKYFNAARVGYKPGFSSLETIKKESNYILSK
jgi:hypothetical protein